MTTYALTMRGITETQLPTILSVLVREVVLFELREETEVITVQPPRKPSPEKQGLTREFDCSRSRMFDITIDAVQIGCTIDKTSLAAAYVAAGYAADSSSAFMTHAVRQGYFERVQRGLWRRLK